MTTLAPAAAKRKSWIDENTGRQITQIGDGAHIGYFRKSKHLPDGRVLAFTLNVEGYGKDLLAIDPETCDIEVLKHASHGYLRVRPTDGKTWYFGGANGQELWEVDLPYGNPRKVCDLPDVPGAVADITCDGNTLIYEECKNVIGSFPIPTGMDAMELTRYFTRRRSGAIYAYDIRAKRVGRLVEMHHVSPAHSDPSPVDPTLVRYTEDVLECTGQRMFSVRTDGSEQRVLRRQEYGEMITHEFWWADPNFVGYTYMDRRGDSSVLEFPWCEYAPRPTRLGICDLRGHEVYLSDPLNSYHAHIYMSPDGKLVCGEGTAWNNFMCVGAFSMRDTRLDLKRLATIRTPWIPTRGSGTNCAFSSDGKWMLYNDLVDGKRQVCRVPIDV